MTFKLSSSSEQRLVGVHPDLVKVVRRALELTPIDFSVTEGLRSKERQAQLVKEGKSQTNNSRHLTGHAVDLAAFPNGELSWAWAEYQKLAVAMKAAAEELGVSIVWGGDWTTLKDGPHFELDRRSYPA